MSNIIILSIVKSLCQRGVLDGVISTPTSTTVTSFTTVMTTQKKKACSSSLKNAIYTPRVYSRTQRRIADSFYQTNGYLTEKKCVAIGLSRRRAENFVKESFVSHDVCLCVTWVKMTHFSGIYYVFMHYYLTRLIT